MCDSRNRNIYIILCNFPSIQMMDFLALLFLVSKMYSPSRKKKISPSVSDVVKKNKVCIAITPQSIIERFCKHWFAANSQFRFSDISCIVHLAAVIELLQELGENGFLQHCSKHGHCFWFLCFCLVQSVEIDTEHSISGILLIFKHNLPLNIASRSREMKICDKKLSIKPNLISTIAWNKRLIVIAAAYKVSNL